jgi:hypothetical protein
MGRCEVCETRSGLMSCGFEDQPMLTFCKLHWVEHVERDHRDSSYAQQQCRAVKATMRRTNPTARAAKGESE